MKTTNRVATVRALAGIVLLAIAVAPQSRAAQNQQKDEETLFFRAPWSGETIGTGAVRPNSSQWAWGESNMIKPHKIRLNSLGLERVNEARKRHGLPLLKVKPQSVAVPGEEVIPPSAAARAMDVGVVAEPSILPSYVDNSTLKYFPPIRSQGSLASCAQFAAVYYTLTHMTAMARDWDAKTGGDGFRFSPKWTYNMLNGGNNVGTWHYDAYA
ncbi:MAG: hypothetical protein N3G20_02430, partial [Verrucomicrobiae bacterium]|nr:hypothetical protein [Verrucomicrobiae bacterium]